MRQMVLDLGQTPEENELSEDLDVLKRQRRDQVVDLIATAIVAVFSGARESEEGDESSIQP